MRKEVEILRRYFQGVGKMSVRAIIYCLLVSYIVLFAGCHAKPEIITQIKYREVFIPVKCEAVMPVKPKYTREDLNSAKELAKYYQETETLLKRCLE